MTVSSQVSKATFTGSGSTGPFPFTFRCFNDPSHIVVTKTNTLGVETVLTINMDYTLTFFNNGLTGGSVTLTVLLDVGEGLVIERIVPNVQAEDLRNQGAFFLEAIEDALDYLSMVIQQNTVGSQKYDMNGERVRNVDDPVEFDDAATKAYVDAYAGGIGNVPLPEAGDIGSVLKAIGVGTFDWGTLGALSVLNTVGTANIDDNAINSNKLADNAVTTLKIANNAVTSAKMVQLAGNSILANLATGTANMATVTFTANTFLARSSTGNTALKTISDAGLALIDDADTAAQRTTLGLGTAAVANTGNANGNVPVRGIGGGMVDLTLTIADDAAIGIQLPSNSSLFILEVIPSAGGVAFGGQMYGRVNTTSVGKGWGGASFTVRTTVGALTGTTGTDGKITTATNNDTVYIENRCGFGITALVRLTHTVT